MKIRGPWKSTIKEQIKAQYIMKTNKRSPFLIRTAETMGLRVKRVKIELLPMEIVQKISPNHPAETGAIFLNCSEWTRAEYLPKTLIMLEYVGAFGIYYITGAAAMGRKVRFGFEIDKIYEFAMALSRSYSFGVHRACEISVTRSLL